MNLDSKIELVLSKEKELANILPSLKRDDVLTLAMRDVFSDTGGGVPERIVSHSEFVTEAKETIIPHNRNYSPKGFKNMRIKKGVTQRAVEIELGLGYTYLSAIETGRTPHLAPDLKKKLTEYYNS